LKRCELAQRPSTTAVTRKAAAFPTIARMLPIDGAVPPATAPIIPATTASTTRPRMSSTTAAPKIMRPSVESRRPRSRNTRAVMPTLVAVSTAPMKTWA
jgi:hypothetical protein